MGRKDPAAGRAVPAAQARPDKIHELTGKGLPREGDGRQVHARRDGRAVKADDGKPFRQQVGPDQGLGKAVVRTKGPVEGIQPDAEGHADGFIEKPRPVVPHFRIRKPAQETFDPVAAAGIFARPRDQHRSTAAALPQVPGGQTAAGKVVDLKGVAAGLGTGRGQVIQDDEGAVEPGEAPGRRLRFPEDRQFLRPRACARIEPHPPWKALRIAGRGKAGEQAIPETPPLAAPFMEQENDCAERGPLPGNVGS